MGNPSSYKQGNLKVTSSSNSRQCHIYIHNIFPINIGDELNFQMSFGCYKIIAVLKNIGSAYFSGTKF